MIEHEALLRAQLAQEENGVVLSGRLVDVLVSHLAKGAKAETKVPSGPEEVIAAAQAGWAARASPRACPSTALAATCRPSTCAR